MKILLLANSDWFLHRFCSELAATLRAAGCEVVLASPPGKFAERLLDLGFRWRSVRIVRRELDPWVEFRTVVGFCSLLRAERPDLVHFFTLKAALYGTLAVRLSAASDRRPAIVNSITGLGYLWSSAALKARFLRRMAELAARWLLPPTRVIFLNRDDLEECRRLGLAAAERSHLIPGSGVDTERFRPSPEAPPGGSRALPVVAFVGRLLWSKGVGACLFASHVGTMAWLKDAAVARAKERQLDGRPIGRHQAVAHKIADLEVRLEAARLLTYRAAWQLGRGRSASREAAIAKLFVSESLIRAALDTVQIHGGEGLLTDVEIERRLRDAAGSTIYSGTSEIQRNLIAGMLGL